MRFRIDFAYDGTEFSGWAAQPGRRTVEGELTSALETVCRVDGLKLTVAGRTDAGVHGRGGVCHVDLDQVVAERLPGRSDRTPAEALVTRLNGVLARDVVVRRVASVSEDFDARFSATQRRYSYRILDRPEQLDPLRRHDTVVVKRGLDVEAMNEAAARLVGLNDFAAFCKSAREPRRFALSCTTAGAGTTRVSSSGGSRPMPSATRWCGPSSARWCLWGRGAGVSAGHAR